MSRADEYRSQYQAKLDKVGQWVAIRRYTGTTSKTFTDTTTRGYVKYQPSQEFVGAIMQIDIVATILVDALGSILPVTTNDRLVTEFFGFDDVSMPPSMDESSHVSGGKERAIKSALKRDPGGTLVAIELHAAG